jgi:hypothetical protein
MSSKFEAMGETVLQKEQMETMTETLRTVEMAGVRSENKCSTQAYK